MSKMATTLLKSGAGIIRRSVLLTAARASSGHGGAPVDQHKGKVASDKVTMPDALGHAVGPERFELLAKLAGNEDPFEMSVKARAKGTFEEPTLIPSLFEKRLVGCICEEDALSINWMYLHKGEPKRCECGYWFKLEAMQPTDYSP
ncbi:cytochrome c oxidase subunit 5B, mitochondrial-like [Gigantopelta aegis]|uniref:cytochrome c oxidase subunit 5B, mitochondrial-like n=1 Tax=Gigantopelta aegis TaxID=1735272 RepID=UPI001B88D070|nr:cytochrome c oxidase subunit 5B, mitochondrial-like [Gigantopelta aegis]